MKAEEIWPEGEGSLNIQVKDVHGRVLVDLNQQVPWFALTSQQAFELARMLEEKARVVMKQEESWREHILSMRAKDTKDE